MPYLNWKTRPLTLSLTTPSLSATQNDGACAQMILGMGTEEFEILIPQLEEIFYKGGTELRMDLPENWIVFWKSRASENRFLLAHPEETEWVATAALEIESGKKLIEDLKALRSGGSLALEDSAYVNNVVIQIAHK